MSEKLELPDAVVARLRYEADRRDITLDDLVAELVEMLPQPPATRTSRELSFIGIGASDSGRAAAQADEMLVEGFGLTSTPDDLDQPCHGD